MTNMERFQKSLILLFDYQRIVGNPQLDLLISETEKNYVQNDAEELSDRLLEQVHAAGEELHTKKNNPFDEENPR